MKCKHGCDEERMVGRALCKTCYRHLKYLQTPNTYSQERLDAAREYWKAKCPSVLTGLKPKATIGARCEVCKEREVSTSRIHNGYSIRTCLGCSDISICSRCITPTKYEECVMCRLAKRCGDSAHFDKIDKFWNKKEDIERGKRERNRLKAIKNGDKWCVVCGKLHHDSGKKCKGCGGR